MLSLRPNCECCNKDLPPEAPDALICSFECTFCSDCAKNALNNTCPNCGGELQARPIRSADMLEKHPASTTRVVRAGGCPAARADSTAVAVSAALEVFLMRGYVGASITDLTAAMRIARPTLYRCFGSKEALFKRVLELHARRRLAFLHRVLDLPTTRDVVERLLHSAITRRDYTDGAVSFLGLLSSLPNDSEVEDARKAIVAHQNVVMDVLAARFARRTDQFEPDASPEALACLIESVIHGIAVQQSSTVPVENLRALAETVLLLWKSPHHPR
jgi:uncharacterized protein